MAVPEAYEDYKINMVSLRLGQFAARVGITRFIPNIADGDAVKFGTLSNDEKAIYRAIFYNKTATETMIDEVINIKENAKIVSQGQMPYVPILMFSSNGNGTGWHEETWRKIQANYASNCYNAEIIELDCSHYIHNYKYEEIADEIREFLN